MSSSTPTVSPEDPLFALIVAVVATHLGETAKVRSVRLSPAPEEEDGPIRPWALEGRRMIYASHRVR